MEVHYCKQESEKEGRCRNMVRGSQKLIRRLAVNSLPVALKN